MFYVSYRSMVDPLATFKKTKIVGLTLVIYLLSILFSIAMALFHGKVYKDFTMYAIFEITNSICRFALSLIFMLYIYYGTSKALQRTAERLNNEVINNQARTPNNHVADHYIYCFCWIL